VRDALSLRGGQIRDKTRSAVRQRCKVTRASGDVQKIGPAITDDLVSEMVIAPRVQRLWAGRHATRIARPRARPALIPVGRAGCPASFGSWRPIGRCQGGGEADEQEIEAAVKFSGAVVGAQRGGQRAHLGELRDRETV
jgi:hypothetical protein